MALAADARPSAVPGPRMPGPLRVSLGLAVLDLAIAGLVLAGWMLGLGQLTSIAPNAVHMKVNAALALVGCAGGLALIVGPPPIHRPRLGRVLAAAAGLLAVATFVEHFAGINLSIDELLFREQTSSAVPYPGRMAVHTSVAFASASLAILLLGTRVRGIHPSQILAAVAAAIGAVSAFGYVYGAAELISLGSASQIAVPAAIALVALGGAIIAANPEHGLVRQLADPGPGGSFARLVFPAAVLIVPISGWLRLAGERAGLYDEQIGVAIMAAFEAILLLVVGAVAIHRVQLLEAERSQARRERDRIFDLSTDLVCVVDATGRMILASPSWQTALGHPLAQLASRPFIDFVHPEDRERTLTEFNRELVDSTPITGFQNRYRSADGSYRWLEWSSMSVPAEGRLYAIARDVTERLRAEEDRARLAAIVESSLDAIIATDLDGSITEWNRAAEQMFGYSAAEAVGRPLSMTAPQPEREVQRDHVTAAAAGVGQRYVAARQRKDGSTFQADLSTFPVVAPGGQITALSTVARDVTVVVEARQALERSAAELARSNAELEQFAYVASHDLQEPLRMVTGFVGLLQRRYENRLGPEADEYITFAVDGAHRMQGLINDLLAYSRVGTRGREPEPTDLGSVIDEVLVNLRPAIEDAGATVDCGALPVVVADRRQIVQLYQNLISNALKFRSEVTPRVEVGGARDGRFWRLFVRDNGIGIAPEHRDQIFVIFRRLHSREAYPGSGIGLAICKKIVERHGGQIWVESSAGSAGAATGTGAPLPVESGPAGPGTTFWFTLPVDGSRGHGG